MNATTSPLTEMPLRHLRRYRPHRHEPPDFAAFWAATVQESRAAGAPVSVRPVDSPLTLVSSYDVRFPGWGGHPISAWLHLPRGVGTPLPCVVEYSGFGSGRGLPHERVQYALAGFAHLVVDARGQSGGPYRCDTPDASPHPADTDLLLAAGLGSPATAYLVRLVVDSVRALDAISELPAVDPAHVAVVGISQGGGLALASAALAERPVAALCCDVPFLCHIRRGAALAVSGPYASLATYLGRRRDRAEAAWTTLSYVDGLNFAARCHSPALFSVGLRDDVCPPSTVFAAFNHYAGHKDIQVWPDNGHEGGEADQELRRFQFLKAIAPMPTARSSLRAGGGDRGSRSRDERRRHPRCGDQ